MQKRLQETLGQERFEHCLRVEKAALKLGKKWRVSEKRIVPAALLHDCARRFERSGLLREAKRYGLEIDPVRRAEPKLFHAEISAILAKREFGIRDQAVLQAIERHTIGAPGMSRLDKIIYLADHIENGRDFPGVASIRRLAFQDLDRAVFESTNAMLRFLLEN